MTAVANSLEDIIRTAKHALVIGVGGGGDVVGALATARFLEFCGLQFTLGGLSWERNVYDAIPAIGIRTELDYERHYDQAALTRGTAR